MSTPSTRRWRASSGFHAGREGVPPEGLIVMGTPGTRGDSIKREAGNGNRAGSVTEGGGIAKHACRVSGPVPPLVTDFPALSARPEDPSGDSRNFPSGRGVL